MKYSVLWRCGTFNPAGSIMRVDGSVCKRIARDSLKGRWLKASFTGLEASIFGVFTNLFTGVLKLVLLTALLLIFCQQVPHYRFLVMIAILLIAFIWLYVGSFVKYGYLDYNLSMLDKRRPNHGILFGASARWWNILYLRIRMILRIIIGGIFFIIPGIVIYYNYAMAPFLLEERKNISVSEAFHMSKEKMKGHRWDFFCLRMSFLLWKVIGVLTLGIAFFWVNPYYALTETVFFNEVSGRAQALYGRESQAEPAQKRRGRFSDSENEY